MSQHAFSATELASIQQKITDLRSGAQSRELFVANTAIQTQRLVDARAAGNTERALRLDRELEARFIVEAHTAPATTETTGAK